MPFNICPDCPENDTMIYVPSMFFYPDLILILSRFKKKPIYPDFIEIFVWFMSFGQSVECQNWC